jgi:hypothetical protein
MYPLLDPRIGEHASDIKKSQSESTDKAEWASVKLPEWAAKLEAVLALVAAPGPFAVGSKVPFSRRLQGAFSRRLQGALSRRLQGALSRRLQGALSRRRSSGSPLRGKSMRLISRGSDRASDGNVIPCRHIHFF